MDGNVSVKIDSFKLIEYKILYGVLKFSLLYFCAQKEPFCIIFPRLFLLQ